MQMEFIGAINPVEEIISQMEGEAVDGVSNECKKRPRDADDWEEDQFQTKKSSSSIHRTVTTEEDDEFLSTLLSEVSVTKSNSPVHATQESPPDSAPQKISTTTTEVASANEPEEEVWHGQVSADTCRGDFDAPPSIDLKCHPKPLIQQTQPIPLTATKLPSRANKLTPTFLVERWTCDVCKSCSFETFEEAELHENQCKIFHDAKKNAEGEQLDTQMTEGWTCDICKSCSFETFEDAEIHEAQCKILRDAERRLKGEGLKAHMTEAWTCDVCKSRSFDTFEEAEIHETQCKILHNAKQSVQTTEAADVLTSLAFCQPVQHEAEDDFVDAKLPPRRHPSINLVPLDGSSSVLSDYNSLLIRNVEFYYPWSDNRVGLRCIHCKDHTQHVTAATFFPSTIGSISSGLGTIGARHFGWGKCPFIPPEIVQQMIETKKTSGLQTRTNGRVGLDAYCRNLAKQYGIVNDETSGISWMEGTLPKLDAADKIPQGNAATKFLDIPSPPDQPYYDVSDSNSIASVLASMKNSTNIETRPFVPSDTEHFWECSGCRSVPFDFRAKGSIVFSATEPSEEKIEHHLKNCTGGKPLVIPQSSTIEPYYGEDVPTIKIKWNSNQSQQSSERRFNDNMSATSVNIGDNDGTLCFPDDQQYTTEFAHFTVMQLTKCFLTKAGGSRGTCPVGFAGLACRHCAGMNYLIILVFHFPCQNHEPTSP
jgi:hypothetical protein